MVANCVIGLAGVASAQPASPVGNWDLLISGAEQGVGFLTFNSDSTVGGWEIVTFRPNNQPTEFTFGRQGIETNGGNTAEFFFFGYTPVTGNWSIATSGQLVGFIAESDGTNVVGSQFSFHGHTRAGKSLVLNTVESPGPIPLDHSPRHTTWSGAPLTNVVDLTGSWLAQGSVSIMDTNGTSSASFSELLTLTSLPKVPRPALTSATIESI